MVRVSADLAEVAADVLREAGAWAVEVCTVAGGPAETTGLRVSLGDHDNRAVSSALARIAEIYPPASWHRESMDESVLSTWRNFCEARAIAGGWTLVPAWRDEVVRSVDPSRRILIDPGSVFGMGDHPTTLAMLGAIDDACRSAGTPIRRMIDAGCGSGILAVFAARAHRVESKCFDIAPEAATVVGRNASANGVEGLVTFVENHSEIDDGWADLVVANIGAGTLVELRPSLARMSSAGATVILGGIREAQTENVISAYEPWATVDVATAEGWCTVTMRGTGDDGAD